MESVQAAARGAPPVRICLIWTIAQYRHPVLHLAAGRHATDLVMSLAGRDLTIGYSDRVVGRGLNVALERGEVLALLGPNGGGKTTLLKTLLGILAPRAGDVA